MDFSEIAKECIENQKAKYGKYSSEYQETMYVAIMPDNQVFVTNAVILNRAQQCLLLHKRLELAETIRYLHYDVEMINKDGIVEVDPIDDELKIRCTAAKMELYRYNSSGFTETLYTCYSPFEKGIKSIWALYTRLKDVKTPQEQKMIADMFQKDETILRKEQEVNGFKFENELLRQERDMYKDLLDKVSAVGANR